MVEYLVDHHPVQIRVLEGQLLDPGGVKRDAVSGPRQLARGDLNYNPIEEAFSKIERFLRRFGARRRDALVGAIGRALSALSAQDAPEASSSTLDTVWRVNNCETCCSPALARWRGRDELRDSVMYCESLGTH